MEHTEKELLNLIGHYPGELQTALATFGYSGDLTPEALVAFQHITKGELGTYLDNFSGLLSATGERKKPDFSKILNTALGAITAAKGVNDFIKSTKNPPAATATPSPVEVNINQRPEPKREKKLLGMPQGIAILAIVATVFILILTAILIFKKK